MTHRSQLRAILHGALLMLISMTVEVPGFIYALRHGTDEPIRLYLRQSHTVLMATGVWMIATGMALPLLELAEKWITSLVWVLIITGYSFMIAIAVFIAGLWIYHPDPTLHPHQIDQLMALPCFLRWTNLGLIAVSGVTSLISGVLIVVGAYRAMRYSITDMIH